MSTTAPLDASERPSETKRPWQFSLRQLLWWFVCLSVAFAVLHSLGRMFVAARSAALQSSCSNNLKQIALGLMNYHDVYGKYPPAVTFDENGKPAHSWRVLITPFLESSTFYDQYRFDEPWNGPNNRLLPDFRWYSCPGEYGSRTGMTSYVAITGPGTPWPDDGTSPTFVNPTGAPLLVVVEVRNSGIHWMEPRDLHIDQLTAGVNEGSGLHVSSVHLGGAMAAFGDGRVQMLPTGLSAEELRQLLTSGLPPEPKLDE